MYILMHVFIYIQIHVYVCTMYGDVLCVCHVLIILTIIFYFSALLFGFQIC